MPKRIVAFVLALILSLSLMLSVALAATAPPNPEIAEITVSVPYFPELAITMTHVPMYCGEIEPIPGAMRQVKFYYGENTTISFNRDITIGQVEVFGTIEFKKDQPVRASDYETGSLVVNLVVSADGSYVPHNVMDLDIGVGQMLYQLLFIDIRSYEPNIEEEGYIATDITAWDIGNTSIEVDYDGDTLPDFTYTISDVITVSKAQIAATQSIKHDDTALISISGKELYMYTVPTGSKVYLRGAVECLFDFMEMDSDGKLCNLPQLLDMATVAESIGFSFVRGEPIEIESGLSYAPYAQGSYLQFLQPGYYIVSPLTFGPQHYVTDTTSENFGNQIAETGFSYGAVILHVVGE